MVRQGHALGAIVHILHSGCILGMKFPPGGGGGVCMVCEWMSNTVALRSVPRSVPTLLSRLQSRDCSAIYTHGQSLRHSYLRDWKPRPIYSTPLAGSDSLLLIYSVHEARGTRDDAESLRRTTGE